MSDTSAIILTPSAITAAMLAAGTTVPVVDTGAGEVAWLVGTAYTLGQRVNHSGSMWECVLASTGVTPGTDAAKWLRVGPTNRMAPFDNQISTRTTGAGSIKFVIDPGFFNGLAIYGLVGEHINIKLYDAPGGTLVQEYDADLYEQAMGLFEYLFMPLRQQTKFQAQDLPLPAGAQLHITITSAGVGAVGVGMIILGFWQTLIGTSFGGVEYGASTEIKTYSYIKTNDYGSTEIVPRGTASNIRCSVVIDAEEANAAADLLAQIAAKPVAVILSGMPRYDYLNTFGLVSGDVTAENYVIAKVNFSVKGYI